VANAAAIGGRCKAIMEFRALGPIELWSAGLRHDLGSARARSLLAMLLLTPNAMIPAEALIDRLWDDRPPPKARESLSVYVARLRAALRHAVGDDVRLTGRMQGGYQLEVDPEAVDVHRFRRLRRQAAALSGSGDFEHAAGLLHEAEGLWRGHALAGIGGEWAARMRGALEEERRAALLERIGCELELGRHADLIGELRHLLASYPLDETLVAHQMTALYRNGRQADALALYRETRSSLVDGQGTEPGPVLAELHQRMLAADDGLSLRLAGRPALAAAPDTLPADTADFVGRDDELQRLAREHGPGPWVAIIEGMPGVGKTTLATRAARLVTAQYPDGAFYLNLHSHDPQRPALDPAGALYHLLRMVSVPAGQIPAAVGARTALWRAHLSRRRAVVILDDAAGRDQIQPLLPVSGQCMTLITTRRRLTEIDGAHTLTLDVLSVDEAVRLFRRIVGESRAIEGDQVAATVGLCGRLPLAVQLTAGRIAQAGPPGLDSLIEEWSQPPSWLGGTGTASPELTAAFDLSYRALEPDQQRFLRRLGASPCATYSARAAAALDDCTLAEAEKALAVLLDCHLLAPAADGRFRLHDLIRGYAAGRARREEAVTEQKQAVGRLLDYYLESAEQADRLLHPFRRRPGTDLRCLPPDPEFSAPDDAASWLESEWRNILQAASFAGRQEWKQQCADLSWLLADFLEIRAHWDEAIAAHTLALQASRYLADPVRTARALQALSTVSQQTGRYDAAIPLAEEAAALCRSLTDRTGEAESLDQIGLAHQRSGRSREALAYFQEARILFDAAGDRRGVAGTLSHAGIASWHLGRYPEAQARLREALALYREVGDRRGEAKALNNLGRVHLYNGQYRDALEAYQHSLQIFRDIGGPQHEAILCQAIGSVHRYRGSYEEALAAYRQALAIYREIGDLPDEADAMNDIGTIYQSASCFDEALVHHQKARLIAEEIGDFSQQLIARRMIADISRCTGRSGEALSHYQSALKLAREIGSLYEEGKILEGIAELTLYTQRRDAARIVFRQALDIFERLGVPEAESARVRMAAIDPASVVQAG
jgi:DNA-binding SARP family transcriptional activator/tetratricopeptide (TPR) repeat protein